MRAVDCSCTNTTREQQRKFRVGDSWQLAAPLLSGWRQGGKNRRQSFVMPSVPGSSASKAQSGNRRNRNSPLELPCLSCRPTVVRSTLKFLKVSVRESFQGIRHPGLQTSTSLRRHDRQQQQTFFCWRCSLFRPVYSQTGSRLKAKWLQFRCPRLGALNSDSPIYSICLRRKKKRITKQSTDYNSSSSCPTRKEGNLNRPEQEKIKYFSCRDEVKQYNDRSKALTSPPTHRT